MEITGEAKVWQDRLEETLARAHVPGASMGLLWGGRIIVVAAGTASTRSRAAVLPETVFQLGSISKIYTATLVGRLLSEAELFAEPVASLLPEAAWLGDDVLVSHLLTHTSGWGGDMFIDTGRGRRCLERYVEAVAAAGPAPRRQAGRYSYCNSGFGLLGRIIEVRTGLSYDAALKELLLNPIGASQTTTLPEDTILSPVAVGHRLTAMNPEAEADQKWNFPRAIGPIGGVCAPASDVLRLVQLHLAGGVTADGERLLSRDYVEMMQHAYVSLPRHSELRSRGLGWGLYSGAGERVIGHDGRTPGQISALRVLPDHELAVVVLTNSVPNGSLVTKEIIEGVLGGWGVAPHEFPSRVEPGAPFEPSPFLGEYIRPCTTLHVSAAEMGCLRLEYVPADGTIHKDGPILLSPLQEEGLFLASGFARASALVRFGDRDVMGQWTSLFDGRLAWRKTK